jgi:hypothetical protein
MTTTVRERRENVKQHLKDAYDELGYGLKDITMALYDLIALEKYDAVRALYSIVPDLVAIMELVKRAAADFEKGE